MKTSITAIITLLAVSVPVGALHAEEAQDNAFNYRRSSICSMLVRHDEQKFADEIERQFLLIPVPDKYNDHDLSVKVVSVDKKGKYDADITRFVENNRIASRLVGKWFNRNILDGQCDLDLIKERGLYNATAMDVELARRSARGIAMLEDAGEDLIGNTYLLMNEVSYVDKSKRSKTWGLIGGIALGVLTLGAGGSASDATNMMNNTADIISSYKGFTVKIETRLYRLVWDEQAQGTFYKEHYAAAPDPAKKEAFENGRSGYRMEYVGSVTSKGGKTSFLGINEEEPEVMVRKACARAIDENVVDLQKKYEFFRVRTPITSVDNGIQAQIGLKEGLTKDSRFEVLEPQEKDGRITYKRVGVVKPVPTKIWDNRFMASEEGAYGADFGATTFVKESGSDFYPGLLLREI